MSYKTKSQEKRVSSLLKTSFPPLDALISVICPMSAKRWWMTLSIWLCFWSAVIRKKAYKLDDHSENSQCNPKDSRAS